MIQLPIHKNLLQISRLNESIELMNHLQFFN